jgi:hypothetical protein
MTDIADAPKTWECTYDLSLLAGGRRFSFKNNDRGVMLTDWRIGWTADGKEDSAPLENIASVRLFCAGDFKNPLNQCQITFVDKHLLTVTDGNEYGSVDDNQTTVYRDFVQALHARLALAPPGTIQFMRGYPATNFYVVSIAAGLLALMCVATPLVMLFLVQKMEVLFVLIAGIGLCWPLYKMVSNNAPRSYDPRQLPEELME